MIRFETEFKAVSAVQVHEPDYVVLFDNKGDVLAVFPRGKYDYSLWANLVSTMIKKLDFDLYCFASSRSRKGKFRKEFKERFLRFQAEQKKACKMNVDFSSVVKGASNGNV